MSTRETGHRPNQDANKITFTPITEGLGFHPFSDGLPYAPITKAPQPTRRFSSDGAGAVSAGPPMIARVSVPIADPAFRKTAQTHSLQTHSPIPTEERAPTQESLVLPRFGVGYLLKRGIAYSLDLGLNVLLCVSGFAALIWHESIDVSVFNNTGALLLCTAFIAVFNWAMITAQEVAFGTSFGKRLFGLTLRGSTWAIFGRALLFAPSLGFAGTGLLWSLFSRQRRCWHDVATDLQPTEVTRL